MTMLISRKGLAVLPRTRQEWTLTLRRAMASSASIDPEQLLVMRDLAGRPARPRNPAPGVVPRESAVLLLCYPQRDDLHVVLTRRSEQLPHHPGQVSLPGGRVDPEDVSPVATALREAEEEIGLDPALVEIWGELETVYIPPSNFQITPVVGYCRALPVLRPNPEEVAELLTVSLRQLLDPATVVVEEWTRQGLPYLVPFYAVAGHKVWGATALVLSELVARMRLALEEEVA